MNNTNKLLLVGGVVAVLAFCTWLILHRPSAIDRDIAQETRSASPSRTLVAPIPPALPVATVDDPHGTVREKMASRSGRIDTYGKHIEDVMIQYWAESTDFLITNQELARAQSAYTALLKARRQLEDRLATVERLEASHFKIVIPAYPEEGQKLKKQFTDSLAVILGSDRAREFHSKTKNQLSRECFGWGSTDQVLDVRLVSHSGVETMEITHGFGLPDEGPIHDFTSVSVSTLSPDDLDIYSYLGHRFPREAKSAN